MLRSPLVAGCVAILLAPALLQSQAPPSAAARFKIDVHYHFRDTPDFVKQTVEVHRKYNTMVCALTSYQALEHTKELVKQYPDVIIPFGGIRLDDVAGSLSQIDAYHAAGFKGVGELMSAGLDYDNPAYFPIYERLNQYHMVALFHTGIVQRGPGGAAGGGRQAPAGGASGGAPAAPRPTASTTGMMRMRPGYLDTIARHFTDLTIVGAHFGNPWYEEAAEAGRWNPNLYFDVSGSSLIKKDKQPGFWTDVLWWRPDLNTRHSPAGAGHAFGRIVFATDEGPEGLEGNIERFQKFLDGSDVPESVREGCWGGTMAKLLGIPVRPPLAQ